MGKYGSREQGKARKGERADGERLLPLPAEAYTRGKRQKKGLQRGSSVT